MRRQTEPDLLSVITKRFEQSVKVPEAFFAFEVKHIAEACWSMARRFHRGGRLLAFGNGAQATDAQHVAVEFVHPVIVGKRALPALALVNDSATLSGLIAERGPQVSFEQQIKSLGRPQDIALGFSTNKEQTNISTALLEARRMGLLTIGLGSENSELTQLADLDYRLIVRATDPLVIQETHETLYHVLWELVHVFFEHEGLLK